MSIYDEDNVLDQVPIQDLVGDGSSIPFLVEVSTFKKINGTDEANFLSTNYRNQDDFRGKSILV